MTEQTPTPITVPDEIRTAIENGAVIAISMSGGKDSQATASAVLHYLDENRHENRVVAVHADLGRAEWFDTMDTLLDQVQLFGLDLTVVQREKGDLLQRMQERAEKVGDDKVFWPSSAARYCTSDLKRGPIDKFLRTLGPLVISVEGLRADESAARARKPCWEVRKQITNSRRDALTWRPIHFWSTEDVWTEIGTSGAELEERREEYALDGSQELKDLAFLGWPAHAAYVRGNERLSCSICILASKSDIENGARHNREYLAELVALEERFGWTFRPDFSLVELAKRLREEEVSRLPWGERRALGVEYDKLYGLDGWETSEGRRDRLQEIESMLAANPLDSYTSEEIDAYNVEHFGDASDRPSVLEGA